ncbi:MAG: hypothetical protein DCC49_05135 [Acidobacteria bacterium]|nr:MAG: hypothetical protein DCC49_05135 [Acidobacteriota bacterium]
MGIFRPKLTKEEKALTRVLARRGEQTVATIIAMRDTGERKADGVVEVYEFTVEFTPAGGAAPVRVTARANMNEVTLTGLAEGEPVRVLYDPENPTQLLVQQSPKYVAIRNPNVMFDGKMVIAVPVAEAEGQDL